MTRVWELGGMKQNRLGNVHEMNWTGIGDWFIVERRGDIENAFQVWLSQEVMIHRRGPVTTEECLMQKESPNASEPKTTGLTSSRTWPGEVYSIFVNLDVFMHQTWKHNRGLVRSSLAMGWHATKTQVPMRQPTKVLSPDHPLWSYLVWAWG